MQEKVLTSSDSPFSPGTLMSLTQLKCTRLSSSIAQLIQELHLGEALDGVISGFVRICSVGARFFDGKEIRSPDATWFSDGHVWLDICGVL